MFLKVEHDTPDLKTIYGAFNLVSAEICLLHNPNPVRILIPLPKQSYCSSVSVASSDFKLVLKGEYLTPDMLYPRLPVCINGLKGLPSSNEALWI